MKQLQLALTNMDSTLKRLPGYLEEIFNPNGTKTNGSFTTAFARRASWVVRIFPYMEENDLTPYAERDGAIELLTRLIRLAPHRDFSVLRRTDESSPLAAAITPHVNGLLDRDADLLTLAAQRWRAMGYVVEADLAARDAAGV